MLATIDDADYKVAIAEAQADLDKAVAQLDGYKAAVVQQQAQVETARADIMNAEAALTFAQQEAARSEDLLSRGAGTTQRAQQTRSDLLQRQGTLTKSRSALIAAEKQVVTYEALAKSAVATINGSQAKLDQAKLNLGHTTIRAPIDGVVGDRSVRVGQLVQAGVNLLTVVPMGRDIYLVANFKETQIGRMAKGQVVNFTVDAFGNHEFRGKVESFSPGTGAQFALLPPENATGNFTKVVQRIPVKSTSPTIPSWHSCAPAFRSRRRWRRTIVSPRCRARWSALPSFADRRREPRSSRTAPQPRGATFHATIREPDRCPTRRCGTESLAHRLARRGGGDPRRLHCYSRHPDHQLLALRHPGRARRLAGGRQLDFDRLSHGGDHRHSADRLARVDLRAAPLSRDQHGAVHRLLARLRAVDEPHRDDLLPRRTGFYRRRADPYRDHHRAHAVTEIAAGRRHRALRAHRDLRAGDRPDGRRLADRQSVLALHLLSQPAARPVAMASSCMRSPRRR